MMFPYNYLFNGYIFTFLTFLCAVSYTYGKFLNGIYDQNVDLFFLLLISETIENCLIERITFL